MRGASLRLAAFLAVAIPAASAAPGPSLGVIRAKLADAIADAPPTAAAPGVKPSLGKPISLTLRLPTRGNASMHLLDLWIRPNSKRPRSARAPRAGISFKIRGRRRPSNLSVVHGAAREGNHIRVATTFVLPHVLETSGGVVPPGDFSFDSTPFPGFSSGLPGVPPGETATVDLFIFDAATGLPMVQPNGQDCGRCAFILDTSRQKQLVRLDDIFSTHPRTAVPTSVCLGFGVIVSQGAGNDALHGFVVNSPTAPFDVSVFGLAPARNG